MMILFVVLSFVMVFILIWQQIQQPEKLPAVVWGFQFQNVLLNKLGQT